MFISNPSRIRTSNTNRPVKAQFNLPGCGTLVLFVSLHFCQSVVSQRSSTMLEARCALNKDIFHTISACSPNHVTLFHRIGRSWARIVSPILVLVRVLQIDDSACDADRRIRLRRVEGPQDTRENKGLGLRARVW